jgi:Tfp pilus assembly protein PilV
VLYQAIAQNLETFLERLRSETSFRVTWWKNSTATWTAASWREVSFVATPSPADEDVKQVAKTVSARAIRLLKRRGVIGEQEMYDAFSEESPFLVGMTAIG